MVELHMTFELMTAGVVLFVIGIIVLLSVKRRDISVDELIAMGRSIYDDREAVFERPNVVVFKVLSYSGMGIVIFAIAWMLSENLR
jgi:hypothetical protein